MMRVLVTGGTGVLGRQVVQQLGAAGYLVRVMSRGPRRAGADPMLEWAQAELASGMGLTDAVAGVDTIVHAATSPFWRAWQVDVEGTQRLVEAARGAGVGHFVHVSIVGIEHLQGYPYYRVKLAGERVIEAGGVPYTIQRATQFYDLIDRFLHILTRLPVLPLPRGWQCQPVDAGEVAARLVALVSEAPQGRAADMGGPEVLGMAAVDAWEQATGKRRTHWRFTAPGAFARSVAEGRLTCPDQQVGQKTWSDWLHEQYGAQQAHRQRTVQP